MGYKYMVKILGFDINLPFGLGLNIPTFALIFNIGIPILYFANFVFMAYKLKGMDKDAPFYTFIKSLVFFFFFYGLGSLWFLWYDFIYMQFTSPNPIDILFGTVKAPPPEGAYLWQVGNLIQNVGLFAMLLQLRKRIYKGKFKQTLPVVWEIVGLTLMIYTMASFWFNLFPVPIISEVPYFWLEMNFLFNFTWSIALPLTYSFIWKNAAGKMKRYALILFVCFIIYGIAWGLRSRTAVYMAIFIFSWLPLLGVPNPFTYELIWLIRGIAIVVNLGLVLYAYRKLLKEF